MKSGIQDHPPAGSRPLSCLALLLFLLPAAFADEQADRFFIHDGDRVVFYGDSITDTEWYPTFIQTYVLTRFPAWRNHFHNRGVSGDNSGSIPRFERDAVAQNPQVIVYNMGFNDGGYSTLQSGALEGWLAHIEQTISIARKSNPRVRIMLASPIVNETVVSKDPRWVSHESYPYVMLIFGRAEAQLAARLQTAFVDTAALYGRTMGLGQVAGGAAFALSRDGVHPQKEGQALLAYHFLRGMGADPQLAQVTLHAGKAKLLDSARCKVRDVVLRDGVLSFTRVCESLPYPTPPVARPFSFLVDLDDTLNADRLTVKGLTAPSYVISMDGKRIAKVAAETLDSGLNLSRYPTTPPYEQGLAVLDAVRQKDLLEIAYWRKYIVAGKADGAGAPLPAANEAERSEMETARRAIADAEKACYALNLPKPHTITLEPDPEKVARYDAEVNADINQAYLGVAATRVRVNWNTLALVDREVTVTLTNPTATPKSGTVQWTADSGWTMSPSSTAFSLDPAKNQTIRFAVSCRPEATLSPPTVTVRSPWTRDWAYPVQIARDLELQPVLTIKPSTVPVTVDGDLSDWKDATSFTLDRLQFIDPAVPGKKVLWNGPADLSAEVFLKWDDAALYLAARVHDTDHIQNESEMMMWSQDMLHIAAQTQEPGKPDGRFEFGFGIYADHDAVARFMNSARDATGPDIQFKSRLDKQGGTCAYEVKIPWSRLAPFQPKAGKSFRFTLAVCDADSQPGKGFNYLEWTPGINYGKNPADFATLILGAP